MLFLETLGRIRLADADGREIDRLMQQPKRLGLLAYLASPSPGTWHRRDVLLGVFWPELDAQRARTALRNALHVLRQHLPAGTIRTRGDDEISIDPEWLATDAALLERDVTNGRCTEALARYDGDYLRGLYIRDAELFERWLDDERRRLSALARRAGLAASEALERSGDMAGAAETLQRVADLDPHDESTLRRVIAIYDRAGDRARALAAYERFRIRLAEDLSAEPSAETVAEVDRVRARRGDLPSIAPVPVAAPRPTAEPSTPAQQAPAPPAVVAYASWRRWPVAAIATVATLGIVFAVMHASAAPRGERLVILPMKNAVADSVAYLGTGIGDDVARRLHGIGGLQTIQPTGGFSGSDSVRRDAARLASEFGATTALRTTLTSAGDSLIVSAALIDLASASERAVGRFAFLSRDAREVGARIAAAIAGTLYRTPVPQAPHLTSLKSVDPESFGLTMRGWYALLSQDDPIAAKELFVRAIDKDAGNARAWAGLSSVWSALTVTWREEWSVGSERAEAAAKRAIALDSTDGTPWANLAILRVLKSRRLSDADSMFAKATSLDPGNPELYGVESALYRHSWQWDRAWDALMIARRLDPLSPYLAERAAAIGLCSGQPQQSLDLFRAAIALNPTMPSAHRGAGRALARMGRWKEAVVELRRSMRDTVPAGADTDAQAEYWELTKRIGQEQLAKLEEHARIGWVAPVQLAITQIWAGNIDYGMSLLEREIHSGDPGLYRLPCQVQVDIVRGTPRFQAVLAALPKWER